MADERRKDVDWRIVPDGSNNLSYNQAQLAVLMDLRDELKQLNRTLSCPNFTGMPYQLQRLRAAMDGLRRDLKPMIGHKRKR